MKSKNKHIVFAKQGGADGGPVEKCVVCGTKTPYRFDTPVDQREHYVLGAGQLCRRCYYEIYNRSNR